MKNYIVGLDIGTTKIACFVGERTEKGRLRIVGFGKTESIGVERGIVKNIRSTADSIRRAVSDASEMAKFDIEEVYVGIAGQHIKSRSNQGSVMIPQEHRLIEKADVDRLIEDQYRIMLDPGEEIIHVFPQCYIVDNDQLDPDIDPVGVAGKCLVANFHIVTGNTGNVHNMQRELHWLISVAVPLILPSSKMVSSVIRQCCRWREMLSLTIYETPARYSSIKQRV